MSDRYRKVPSARLSRLAAFGQLAGGLAGGVIAEGARRLAKGERPQLSSLVLTPANVGRVTEQLSRLRGAAMKLGQMISLDAGDVLPPELTEILARLRDAAHFMPPAQLNKVLVGHWGADWRKRFARFDPIPIAAASIGQVHRARLHDGREVAVKVQYPGVAASIEADVDNVATLLHFSGLLPAELDIAPLLAEAKRQLAEETDYLREAAQMRRYGGLLADDRRFVVPSPVDHLTGEQVLVMDFVPGRPIDDLAHSPQEERNEAMAALLGLVLGELFRFGFMQTDPNFANYRWQPDTGRIVLLDFGAARPVAPATSAAYARLLRAGLVEDHDALRDALLDIGFVSRTQVDRHRVDIDAMIAVIVAHVGRPGQFDFADRRFVEQVRQHAMPVFEDRANWHLPPAETLFVQRKVSGTALLAVRMKAQLPLREMVAAELGGMAADQAA
ncbi:ABC1 kinase family protein [Novosphingobium huizhouense]|uniref:ABC1 kinase family protein n=1 Tax=Novosphingobium huizhouense TaxID=2866625 RepID=UPI001CD8713F|nr:AarF/ABC1/UbiB kinase family protein [Novosphingobium huizhouense]